MISTLPASRRALKPRAFWVGAVALTASFLFGSHDALAAPPPANTIIGNQASATYLDPNGASQLATSNLVQTTVQQVGSFNLDTYTTVTTNVVNTKTGAAGTTVYAPHVLTNTGNGPDAFNIVVDPTNPAANPFSKVEVFADANADGVPDSTTALCSVPTGGTTCVVPPQTVAGGNGTFPFVVAYTIPGTAASGTFPAPAAATITASPVPSTVPYTQTSAADRDNVNLTTSAAFNATKSIAAPSVASAVSGGAWPAPSTTGPRSGASCALTPSAAVAGAAGCSYTTYTLRFNNTGGAAGTFYMSDVLPSGFTYVPGSAVWSNAPGVALTDASAGDTTGIDYQVSGTRFPSWCPRSRRTPRRP